MQWEILSRKEKTCQRAAVFRLPHQDGQGAASHSSLSLAAIQHARPRCEERPGQNGGAKCAHHQRHRSQRGEESVQHSIAFGAPVVQRIRHTQSVTQLASEGSWVHPSCSMRYCDQKARAPGSASEKQSLSGQWGRSKLPCPARRQVKASSAVKLPPRALCLQRSLNVGGVSKPGVSSVGRAGRTSPRSLPRKPGRLQEHLPP